jgi:tetratricopeptide (TPR) repeat protein
MDNGFDVPEMRFKKGYINYVGEDYYAALRELFSIRRELSTNQNFLFALGNTLYQRGDYFAAQGFYSRLLDILEEKKNKIPIIRPEEIPEHLALIELLMKAHNNLGVTLVKLSESPLDPEKETAALVNFVQSTEYFDVMARDPETLARGDARSLSDLNARQIQYPQPNYIIQIYNRIPKDPSAIRF